MPCPKIMLDALINLCSDTGKCVLNGDSRAVCFFITNFFDKNKYELIKICEPISDPNLAAHLSRCNVLNRFDLFLLVIVMPYNENNVNNSSDVYTKYSGISKVTLTILHTLRILFC